MTSDAIRLSFAHCGLHRCAPALLCPLAAAARNHPLEPQHLAWSGTRRRPRSLDVRFVPTAALNFFRSIVTFSCALRLEFALGGLWNFPSVPSEGAFSCRARIPTSRVSS